MSTKDIFRAGLAVLALAAGMALTPAAAQTLRVMEGSASGALNVPMNRAVVVESDRPFAELSIANPASPTSPPCPRPRSMSSARRPAAPRSRFSGPTGG